MPNIKLAVGVGGSFDFVAGKQIRAPLLMQKLGLEWLWRLVCQPSRWKRIWTAVVVFSWLVAKK
jgi:N-acetylglucosaminyldiphosphoundecaprenol N-acetyl-beta-D-mannosaminyltransferase